MDVLINMSTFHYLTKFLQHERALLFHHLHLICHSWSTDRALELSYNWYVAGAMTDYCSSAAVDGQFLLGISQQDPGGSQGVAYIDSCSHYCAI